MLPKGQKVESDIDLWQKRIGHINFYRLQELQVKQIVFVLPNFSGRKAQVREAYQLGKQHRIPFLNEQNRCRNKLNLRTGIESRYFVSFIDEYSRHTSISLIEKKIDVFDYFRNLKSLVEKEIERKIKCPRSDGGKEYFTGQF